MRKKTWIKAAVMIALAAVILTGGLIFLQQADQAQYTETRSTMSEGFGQLQTLEWNGTTYREKPAVTTILIAGIDKTEETETSFWEPYRSGGQADFLLLMAIDHTNRQIHPLQIDRDTIDRKSTRLNSSH